MHDKAPVTTAETIQTTKKVAVMPAKISIKAKTHSKNNEEHIISQIEKPHDPFDDEKLLKVIETYAGEQEKLNRMSWAFTVKDGQPAIKHHDHVIFTLYNKTQEVEFNKNREEFTQFLRDQLNNQFIIIETELKEKEELVTKSIDPLQRFDNMVKENPLLIELRNTFNLDI